MSKVPTFISPPVPSGPREMQRAWQIQMELAWTNERLAHLLTVEAATVGSGAPIRAWMTEREQLWRRRIEFLESFVL